MNITIKHRKLRKMLDEQKYTHSEIVGITKSICPEAQIEYRTITLPRKIGNEVLDVGFEACTVYIMEDNIKNIIWSSSNPSIEEIEELSPRNSRRLEIFDKEEFNKRFESLAKKYPNALVVFQKIK